jgi:two-component system C4-dicarboxylate transport sensor histidine kinase DctB
MLQENRITVRTHFPDERVEVVANRFELGQVVFNILHNARHELLKVEQRIFDIACIKRKGKAVLSFRDSGPGIDREHRERIFEPFYTTKPEGEGTGLGLSIARRIAEEHGGSLKAEEGRDGGAAFILELPLADALPEYCGSAVMHEAI